MAEIRARAITYILDEEDDAFKRKRAKMEKEGDQRDASSEGKQSKVKGEGGKQRDKKIKSGERAAKEPLYPRKESFKRCRPDIVISSIDFEGIKTHKDDPVVVMVRINIFNVRRVLLDQESSADIIYGDAFDQLGLTENDLMPYIGTLVGFSGEQVWVRGYLDLDTVFGVDEDAKLLRVRYLVLQVVASYNVIIGRNTLNRLCAVISTAHLAVKYPLICEKGGKNSG
ncbi:uncharacterized protein LOC130736349 [Lotus japonicus]|uniref:uncharacterized protein LOC130736349 n=1 Tax=Lotus japonicus TaxID=34305 RepID=UPI002585C97B|nr:uncharacterized protein LOC130736349 [Lotus japonicus]